MSRASKPVIIPRAKWWADPADFSRMKKHAISYVTLHHSGVAYHGDPPPLQRIRKLQDFSFNEKGWPDIPYHFKIDLEGNIWEGRDLRYCGETNTTYDPSGHALICVMGNFEEQSVTGAQIEAVVHLCAWLCDTYDVPPDRIKGHKDYAETLCPGKDFYPYIKDGTISRRVEDLLRESQ